MGRRPNQVILQHFNRGEKLNDNSNRYVHDCKLCGEHFPKGRLDTLINHLTKKCSSLSQSQRQDIVIQYYGLGGLADTAVRVLPPGRTSSKVAKPRTLNIPFSPGKQRFNSLNILAEASRRVDHLPLDPTLDIDGFTESFLNDDDHLESDLAASQGASLSSIAASANDIVSLVPGNEVPHIPSTKVELLEGISEHALLNYGEQASEVRAEPQFKGQVSANPPPEVPSSPPAMPDAVSREAHFVPEFGTTTKIVRPRVRGKFSPGRREEVRIMRHKGACLRCRMLKKTCSSGDPCQACTSVESPRIWRNPCIRTKLVNEFSLYTMGLQSTILFREIATIKQRKIPHDSGKLDIYNLDESPTGISFDAARLVDSPANSGSVESAHIVGTNNEDIATKAGLYLRTSRSNDLYQNENNFLQTTVRVLSTAASELNDSLLSNIVWLWMCTVVMVDDKRSWQGVLSKGRPEGQQNQETAANADLPVKLSASQNKLISAQLRVGFEAFAKSLARSILTETERRLLQKQQEQPFYAFLGAILTLNCFERICWLFRAEHCRQPGRWPFPQPAEDYVCQGERFANIIELLVDMRSLPPKSSFDPVTRKLRPEGEAMTTIAQWYEEISLTDNDLDVGCRKFDELDFRSLDGTLFARLLLPERQISGTVEVEQPR